MNIQDISILFGAFTAKYNVEEKNAIWQLQSQQFRDFWNKKIMPAGKDELNDAETDEIVRILDRHGKGNTASSEAVGRAMIAQGAWRRMFNQIKAQSRLSKALDEVFIKSDTDNRASAIDKVYEINEGQRNNLTGQSGLPSTRCLLPMIRSQI